MTEEPAKNDLLVVGQGFRVVGTVHGTGLCIVEGSVDGSLEVDDIKINPKAYVSGDVKCLRLDLAGHVQGSVEAQDVLLRSSAVVESDIKYSTISMESGSVVNGQLLCTKVKVASNDQPLFLEFPDEIHALMESGPNPRFTLKSGEEMPSWISVQPTGVVVQRRQLSDYVKSTGAKPELVIKIGESQFTLCFP